MRSVTPRMMLVRRTARPRACLLTRRRPHRRLPLRGRSGDGRATSGVTSLEDDAEEPAGAVDQPGADARWACARCRSTFSRRQASSWRVMPERLLCGPSGRAWSTPADSRCAGDRRSIAGGPAACALRRVSRSGLICMEEARGACRGAHYIGLWPSDVVVCVHALVTYLSHTLLVLVWTALRHL